MFNHRKIASAALCLIGLVAIPATRAIAEPPGYGWPLTFSDEFNNQSTYDHSKWSPLIIWGGHTCGNSSEVEYFVDAPKNIDVTSGTSLKLTAIADNPVTGYVYSSGLLSSHNSFNQTFGYFEIRAKFPSGSGFWPAFWTLEGAKEGAGYAWPPEIDIMEYLGNVPKGDYTTNHYSSSYPLDGGNATGLGDIYTCSQDLSQGFHTYSVNWEPDQITWYEDGVPRYSTTYKVPYLRAMHVILNLALGGWNNNVVNANTVFPQSFEVDYVRVYSKPLPSPWAATDLGSPAIAGRTYASSTGLFNVQGSGAGVTGTNDQCQFAYQSLNGDGTIIARVKNEMGTNAASKAAVPTAAGGLMIRESLSGNAVNALMAVRPVIGGTAGGNIFSSRSATSGSTSLIVAGNTQTVPSWLKLVRSGSNFTGYSSPDGTTWTQNGSVSLGMASSAYAGFAVTCSNTTSRATAQFDNISITGTATPGLTSISISPASCQMEPGSTFQFAATANDQYGDELTQQPAINWNVSGGGTINSSGLVTAGTSVGGPFAVTASNAGVSGTASLNITAAPNAPASLTATTATMLNGWLKLTWTDSSNCETGYTIAEVKNGTTTFSATVGPNVTTWTRTGLSMPSGPYYYKVYASGTGGQDSAYATITVSIPSPPAGPTGLTATAGAGQVVVSWSPVSGASNYTVSRSLASGSGYSTIKSSYNSTTYTDTAVTIGTTYYYQVSYNTSGGASSPSGPVSATPVGALAAITMSPASVSVQAGSHQQQFTAVARDSFGNALNPQPTITWTTNGGGSISTNGLFTSSATVGGPYTVTAMSGTVSGTGSVSVVLSPPVFTTITVSPAIATVQLSSNQQFSAVGYDQYSAPMSSQPTFTWTSGGGGTIGSSGLFTAGSTVGGPYTITATSGTLSGTASATVVPPPPVLTTITVSPGGVNVQTDASQQFSAVGYDQYGAPMVSQPIFTWTTTGTFDGGAIDSSGNYSAGTSVGGPYTVTATSGTLSGIAKFSLVKNVIAPLGSGWNLTFNDEFNNESVYDHSKWSPLIIWGGHTCGNSSEVEYFVDAPKNIDTTSGTSLKLTAIADSPATGYAYSSGLLSSHNSFNQAFGYFEIRAKFPSGSGFWPAFWTLEGSKEGAGYAWPPEIDITEYLGNAPKADYTTNHYSTNYPLDDGNATGLGDIYTCSQDLSQGFHTYSVNWEPDQITWYEDGVPRYSTTYKVPYLRAMHVLLNLALGGWNNNVVNVNTVLPQSFEVDYVRVYSKLLPSPWAATDLGSPEINGRTYASSTGLFNVQGSGAGIMGTNDQCQFAYQSLNGDGIIIARVKNEVGTNAASVAAVPTAAGGLMIRESLSGNAVNAFMALRPVIGGTAGGNNFSSRSATSGSTSLTVAGNNQTVPSWLKLVRSGSNFTGYSSPDGTTWTQIGSVSLQMASSAYVGFAVTCSKAADRATAQFDNISVTGSAAPGLASISVSPGSSQMEPGSTFQFAATANDQFGNVLTQQPAVAWNVSGGATINSSGLITAGASVGGPFAVTASNAGVSGTAFLNIANAPNPPALLTATTAAMLNGWLKLNWTDNSNCETGYTIAEVKNGTTTFSATVGPNVTTWTRTGLSMPSGPYYYKVYASGTGGLDSAYATITVSIPAPPPGPTGLTATAGAGQVVVSWSSVSGASSYTVSRSLASGSGYSTIKSNNNGTTYTDAAVTIGTTYYYQVTYITGAGASLPSGPASATPLGALAAITVSPANVSVQTGSAQQFTAAAKDSFGNALNPQPAITWATNGGGTIGSNGLFSATTAGGSFAVTATSGTVSGTASVTVTLLPPVLATITVSPPNATVMTGSSQQFTVLAIDQFGNNMSPQPMFTWSVEGGGTIDSSGLFASGTVAGGPYTVSVTSGTIGGSASVIVKSPFSTWQTASFTPTQLGDASLSGPTATPANDGISNLMKYALDLNPMTTGVAGLPVIGMALVSGSNYLTLTYAQVKAATDINYTVEVSGDLSTWNSGTGYTAPVGTTDKGTTQTVVVQDLVPLSSATKRFIRLKVTLP